MGLLDYYKSNPGRQWSASDPHALVFDFNDHSLAGIKIGADQSLMWRFGPSEDPIKEKEGIFRYYSKGFEVSTRAGRIDGFILTLCPSSEGRFTKFPGSFCRQDTPIPLQAGMGADQIVSLFDEPLWKNEDDEEIILFYQRHAVEYQFEISKSRGLTVLTISTIPQVAES